MKKFRSWIALALSVVLLLSLFTGCSSQKKQEQKKIGVSAGCDVLYEELRYVTLTYKDLFESTYGKGIWDDPATAEQYRAELEETVWSVMLNNYAVLAVCQEYGMLLSDMEDDSIVAAVDKKMEEAVAQCGGEAAFQKALEEMHMTEHLMRFVLAVAQMESELIFVLTDDFDVIEGDVEEFTDWLENGNCVYVRHVFVQNDAGDDKEANRAAAESLRQRLQGATESEIDDIIRSAENEELMYLKPYYIVRDVYDARVETAAFGLSAVGDVSDVIEVDNGFYVLIRVAETETSLLTNVSSLLSSYQWAKTEQLVEAKKATLTIELNEYGKSIDLLKIK
ncbi:MAG: hypothetical protein IKJ35_04030 [Clostridia bacterium]|nr:hypothetical protein [Clostridia bacterium]